MRLRLGVLAVAIAAAVPAAAGGSPSAAKLHLVLELVLQPLEAVAPLLDQRQLVPLVLQEHAREVRPDLAAAGHEDVHQTVVSAGLISQARTASIRTSIATEVGQIVRSPRRR